MLSEKAGERIRNLRGTDILPVRRRAVFLMIIFMDKKEFARSRFDDPAVSCFIIRS